MKTAVRELSPAAERIARRYAKAFAIRLPFYIDHEELIPEAMLAAWKAEKVYDASKGATLESWIKGCVWKTLLRYRHSLDHLNPRLRSKRNEYDLPEALRTPLSLDCVFFVRGGEFQPITEVFPVASSFVDAYGYTNRLWREELLRAMERLTPKRWEAVYRVYWLHQSHREAGEAMGTSKQNVDDLIQHALKALRQALKPQHSVDALLCGEDAQP